MPSKIQILSLSIFWTLLLVTRCFGQAAHRIGQVLVKGNNIAANVSPYASIKVCVTNTGCATLATVYSDSGLTQQLRQPLTADGSGNYDYYLAPACVDEQISAPGAGQIQLSNVCSSNGAGANLTPNAIQFATSSSATQAATAANVTSLFNGGTCGTLFLKGDGSCAGSTATPGGSNLDNQINIGGSFGVDHGVYTYNSSIHTLYAPTLNSPLATTGPQTGLPNARLNVSGNANLGTVNFTTCSSSGTSCGPQMESYFWGNTYTQRAPGLFGQNGQYGAHNIIYTALSGGTNNNIDGNNGIFTEFTPSLLLFNQFTPGQGGGTHQVNVEQNAAGDSVWDGGLHQCWASNRGQDEGCEVRRFFESFINPNSGGTLSTLSSATPEGHRNITITPFGGYNVQNLGEENYLVDVTKRAQLGNFKGVGFAGWDTGHVFPEIQLDTATSYAVTSHTSITATVNGDVYSGCPSTDTGQFYPLVASAPYGDLGVGSKDAWVTRPDGTGVKGVNGNYDPSSGALLGYCYTVSSTNPGGGPALTSGTLVFIAGGAFTAEFSIATVVDSTHFRAFTHHNHAAGETVAWGAAIGQALGANSDERPPHYSETNQNGQFTTLRLVNPIVSVEDSTHITVYPIAEATSNAWITLDYNGYLPTTPLTLTPTIAGGALTSISPSTPGNYSLGSISSVSGNAFLPPPQLTLISSSATTYVQTNFNESGTGQLLGGTTPAVCQSGCSGTWTLTGGHDFTYQYGGGATSTQANPGVLSTFDVINTGHANENIQAHLNTITSNAAGSSFNNIVARYTDQNNYVLLQIGSNTFPTVLSDVVAGVVTVLASTGPGLGVTGDYTLVLNGTTVTAITPYATLSGTTANTTATKAGIGFQNGTIIDWSSFLVTSLNGTCSLNPVIKFQHVNIANVHGYQPSIVSGGSGCPSDLAINLLQTQNRAYSVPVAIINKVVDPANLPTPTNPNVVPDGNIQLQALNASLWSTSDEVQETMLPGRYMGNNESYAGDPIISNSPRFGPPQIKTISWVQSGQPLENLVNGTPSSAFIGTFAGNWTGLTPDQVRMVANPFKLYQGVGNGLVFNLPPVSGYGQVVGSDATAPSIGGALLTVNCSAGTLANVDHPCLHGQNGIYTVLQNFAGTQSALSLDTHNGLLNWSGGAGFFSNILGGGALNLTGNTTLTSTNFNISRIFWSAQSAQRILGECNLFTGVAPWDFSLTFGNCHNTTDLTGTAIGPAADGILYFGSATATTAFSSPSLAAGYAPPLYSSNPVFTGSTGGTPHDRSYILEAVLPNGAVTAMSALNAHNITSAVLDGTHFVTNTCPTALQFGYPGGTIYKLITADNTGGGTRDLGTCTLGGTVVDDGSVTTPGTQNTQNWSSDVGAYRHIVAPGGIFGAASDQTSSFLLNAGISSPAANTWAFGNGTVGDSTALIKSGSYIGPATAPSGSCSVVSWVLSQDGHATFCNGTTWVTKI